MKILVACEESQAVTIELRKLGHEAYSCDIIECSGGHPEWHIKDDVIEIKKPDPESHFKLLPCKCGSDNVAYVHYNGRGGAKWRVECFDCGYTVDKGNTVRHDAQVLWNRGVHNEKT